LFARISNRIISGNCLILVFFLSWSCSPTRRLAEDEYLLNKTVVDLDSKEIDIHDLKTYEKQIPNKTILGIKFHLFLYNLASPGKEKFPSGWLKKIGEEPVIWNPMLTERTTEQFRDYLETKGYYTSVISDTVLLRKQKANIIHSIQLNEPHRIRNIAYRFEDQKIADLVLKDTVKSLIKPGARFDKEVFQLERQRIEELLKNNGYFKFSKEYIFFDAIEVFEKKLVDLRIVIKENIAGIPDPETKVRHHQKYKIHSIYIYPDFGRFSTIDDNQKQQVDTINVDGNHIIYSEKLRIKPEAVMLPNRCNPGNIYKLNDVKKTYSNYSSLGLFRVINIHFKELGSGLTDTGDFRYIDNYIELSPRKPQSYQFEIVGTNSAGDWGARANILFNNFNLFRGAENLEIKITGAIEQMTKQTGGEYTDLMREGGFESTLSLPKILVPFSVRQFSMRYNPRTLINFSYNYQNQSYYIRTIASTSLSYKWKGNQFNSHQLYPIEFNYVRLPEGIRDSVQRNMIMGTYLENSFIDHTILAARYVFEYTTQVIERKEDYIYLRASLESAGSVIYGVAKLTPSENDTTFMKVPFFRYLKCDADFRINNQVTPDNRVIYRIFAGVGYPLGDQRTLPFEKMYFAGGPYGIRAWESYSLGPGSEATDTISYAYRLGDVKLETNIEYRFKLFWVMEGALFIDAGNIWRIYENRPVTAFAWDRFYKEIAVGTGLGFRFDFNFLIIRTDFGIKLRDPSIQEGSRWIDFNRSVDYKFLPINLDENQKARLSFQFGIGYPF